MKKKLLILAALMVACLIPQPAQAQEEKMFMAGGSAVLKNIDFKTDIRVEQLENFLNDYNSPLASYAQVFVEMADKYQIDWRLLPAISGVESCFGKQIPPYSYNAYGWNNGNFRFESWEDSIEIVSKALKERYYNLGLDTPDKIGRVYAPPSKTWAIKVNYFIEKIEKESFNLLLLTI